MGRPYAKMCERASSNGSLIVPADLSEMANVKQWPPDDQDVLLRSLGGYISGLLQRLKGRVKDTGVLEVAGVEDKLVIIRSIKHF